jgi:hypothetical protein
MIQNKDVSIFNPMIPRVRIQQATTNYSEICYIAIDLLLSVLPAHNCVGNACIKCVWNDKFIFI